MTGGLSEWHRRSPRQQLLYPQSRSQRIPMKGSDINPQRESDFLDCSIRCSRMINTSGMRLGQSAAASRSLVCAT